MSGCLGAIYLFGRSVEDGAAAIARLEQHSTANPICGEIKLLVVLSIMAAKTHNLLCSLTLKPSRWNIC